MSGFCAQKVGMLRNVMWWKVGVDLGGTRVYCWTDVANDPKKRGGGKMIRLPDLFYLILTHVHSRPFPRFNLDDSACGRPLSCCSDIDPKPASFFLVEKIKINKTDN